MPAPLSVAVDDIRTEPRSSDLQIALHRIEEVGKRHDAQLRDVATVIREDRRDNAAMIDKMIGLSVSINRQNSWLIITIVGFVLTCVLLFFGHTASLDLPAGIHFGSAQ